MGIETVLEIQATRMDKDPMVETAKRGGRKERLAKRAGKPAVDAGPPDQIGGAYKPLSAADLAAIYHTALKLLENLGLGKVADRLRAAEKLVCPHSVVHDKCKCIVGFWSTVMT
jgi:trimethylamine:corrinoid methyltransferase-like protein